MVKQLRTIALCLMALIGAVSAWAEEVSFQAAAPGQVILGRAFQISYTVNQHARDLRAPEMTDFDIVAGPYTSQSSSTSIINGKRTTSFTLRYTYTVLPKGVGTFTIQPASIVVEGKQYRSNGLKIQVLPADEPEESTGNQSTSNRTAASGDSQTQKRSSNATSADNIFIRTLLSKTKVHEQECVLLQYKLYFAGVDVAQFTGNTKIPEFTGFLKQELEQGEIQLQLEHLNGRNYQTAILYQTLLYPQRSGDLEIAPASFEAVLRVQNRSQSRSIFDDFFASYSNVTKPLTAPGATIHVSALPSGKPAGFSGGVGRFTTQSSISANSINNNEAVTLRLDISGAGNMKLIKTPEVDWPEGFEVYDPKVTNNFKTTTSGISGTKQIEYLAIARAAGDYTIPPITFSYFDTETGSYKTLTTEAYTLHVARGSNDAAEQAVVTGNYQNKEDIKQLGEDIRYIHSSEADKVAGNDTMPRLWYLYFVLPTLLSLLLFFLFRKQIRENADQTRVRYKKANKVARKRLKTAQKLLGETGKDSAFYEEILNAAWLYLSDRLSIATADLTKDKVKELLRLRQVDEQLIQEVIDLLNTAEFARYSSATGCTKEALYNQTATIIDQLESCKL